MQRSVLNLRLCLPLFMLTLSMNWICFSVWVSGQLHWLTPSAYPSL